VSNQFKIFLLVALSFLSSFDLSANDTFFSIEKSSNRVYKLADAGSGLLNFPKIRSFIGDGRVLAHLNNQELNAFENLLKTADPDVLKTMDEFDGVDEFAEMVRGYKDNPAAFTDAIKNTDAFNGGSGWLNAWGLTSRIKEGLSTLRGPLSGKLLPVGGANEIQLATIQTFTRNGNFINVPKRYSKPYFGAYDERAYKHMINGMDELFKVPARKVVNQVTFSGKTFSLSEYNLRFVGNMGNNLSLEGIVSSSKLKSVAEGFTVITRPSNTSSSNMVSIIYRITTKEGVYIDDLSDWGKNLGNIRHSSDVDVPPSIIIQEEVIMKGGYFKQTSEPIKIMENGIHKTIDGIPAYYVDIEELLIPIN
jgi:hypothetical protein